MSNRNNNNPDNRNNNIGFRLVLRSLWQGWIPGYEPACILPPAVTVGDKSVSSPGDLYRQSW